MKGVLNIIKSLTTIPPVFTDGFLLVLASLCSGVLTYLSAEDAYHYVHPILLFWLKLSLGSTATSISALIAFRSKVYTQHQQQVKADATGQTQIVTTTPAGIKVEPVEPKKEP